jgi:hypothetical protein
MVFFALSWSEILFSCILSKQEKVAWLCSLYDNSFIFISFCDKWNKIGSNLLKKNYWKSQQWLISKVSETLRKPWKHWSPWKLEAFKNPWKPWKYFFITFKHIIDSWNPSRDEKIDESKLLRVFLRTHKIPFISVWILRNTSWIWLSESGRQWADRVGIRSSRVDLG